MSRVSVVLQGNTRALGISHSYHRASARSSHPSFVCANARNKNFADIRTSDGPVSRSIYDRNVDSKFAHTPHICLHPTLNVSRHFAPLPFVTLFSLSLFLPRHHRQPPVRAALRADPRILNSPWSHMSHEIKRFRGTTWRGGGVSPFAR